MATTTFAGTGGRQRSGILNPPVTRSLTPGDNLEGAPTHFIHDEPDYGRLWPDPPPWWWHSLEEWIVYWWLKYKLKFEEGTMFYYQGRVYVPYLFQKKDYTQADFIIDCGPDTPVGQIGDLTALVLDPFTEFTHDKQADFERWQALHDEGYGLIYMAEHDIKYRLPYVMREALAGKDVSNRGWGAV